MFFCAKKIVFLCLNVIVCVSFVYASEQSGKNPVKEEQTLFFNQDATNKVSKIINEAEKGSSLVVMNNHVSSDEMVNWLVCARGRGVHVAVVAGNTLSGRHKSLLKNNDIELADAISSNSLILHTKALLYQSSDGSVVKTVHGSQNGSLRGIKDNVECMRIATDKKSFNNVLRDALPFLKGEHFHALYANECTPKKTRQRGGVITPSVKSTAYFSPYRAVRQVLESTPSKQHDEHIVTSFTFSGRKISEILAKSSNTTLYVDSQGIKSEADKKFLAEEFDGKNNNKIFVVNNVTNKENSRGSLFHPKMFIRINKKNPQHSKALIGSLNAAGSGFDSSQQINHASLAPLGRTDQNEVEQQLQELHAQGRVRGFRDAFPGIFASIEARRAQDEDPLKEKKLELRELKKKLKEAELSRETKLHNKRQKTDAYGQPIVSLAVRPDHRVQPRPLIVVPLPTIKQEEQKIQQSFLEQLTVASPVKNAPSPVKHERLATPVVPLFTIKSEDQQVSLVTSVIPVLRDIINLSAAPSVCAPFVMRCNYEGNNTCGCGVCHWKLHVALSTHQDLAKKIQALGFSTAQGGHDSIMLSTTRRRSQGIQTLLDNERKNLGKEALLFLRARQHDPALWKNGDEDWLDTQWKQRCDVIRLLARVKDSWWLNSVHDDMGADLEKRKKDLAYFSQGMRRR